MKRSREAGRESGDAAPIAPIGPGMVERSASLSSPEVVFLKGILEAHEGIAQVYAEKGGALTICTTTEQARELDALLLSLTKELPSLLLG